MCWLSLGAGNIKMLQMYFHKIILHNWDISSFTGLWGIINNAGIAGQVGPCEWLTLDDYKACTDVNLWGVIDCTLTFLPLIKKEKGRIVNIASVMGRFSLPEGSTYSVSKFGVEAFTDSLRYTCIFIYQNLHILVMLVD